MGKLESAKEFFRRTIPSKYGWSGNYMSWHEALSHSGGYDDNSILQKVKNATIQVKEGRAKFERDAVLFDHIEYSWPLLSSLLWISAQNGGNLKVIDFGGSLGSSYFQNKLFLDKLKTVEWNVIEQRNFVECGRQFIQDGRLRFFNDINECIQERGIPDLILFACTLPYLENPYGLLSEILGYRIPYLIIDNTPFNFKDRDRLTVQKVPPSIYEASYPCWFLDYKKVLATIRTYSIIVEYLNDSTIILDGKKLRYRGLLAVSKSN